MKKLITIILSMVLCMSALCMLMSCNIYKVPENHCIVGLWQKYQLYSDSEGKLCEPIEQEIKGVDKASDMNYYSVIKGADYTIIVDSLVEDDANRTVEIDGENVPCEWWGLLVTCFAKTYSEKSGLQDEVFFTTDLGRLGENIKVSFTENCTVKTAVENYQYVGGIYEVRQKSDNMFDVELGDCIDENGTIKQADGVYYLLLKDSVCIHQDAWKTNLEITDYKYEYSKYSSFEYGRGICAQFTAKKPVVAENEELYLYIICRTESYKYFVYPTVLVDTDGFGMPIRENELNLSFE